MTIPPSPFAACPVCGKTTPPERISETPYYCSIACFRIGHGMEPPSPSCHDGVTMMTCPVDQRSFAPTGRQRYCSDACRAAAYRRRRDAGRTAVVIPAHRPKRPITVYECDSCGERALGQQRCETCRTFMRRVGTGGCCPSCDEPITASELIGEVDAP